MERIAEGFKSQKAIVTPYNVRNYQATNPVTRQMYITSIGYYPKAKYHYRERPKGCTENILIYCEAGKGWIKHNETVYPLSRNHVFIIPAHEAHAYGADRVNPWSIYWFHFCGENVSRFSSIIGQPVHVEESDKSRYEDRFQLFEEMYANLGMGYSPENMEYVSYCLLHFLVSLKYINQFREIKKAKQTDVVQKSIQFMKDNLENNITLDDLARQACFSAGHFGVYFLKKTSYTPMEYYNQLKIQKACSFLQFSDMKIKEIAFRLGYYDPFHFSKAFRLEMGMTPKEYRKNMQPICDGVIYKNL